MLKTILTHLLILSTASYSLCKTNPETPTSAKQKQNISFTENKGQVYDQNYKARPDVLYGTMTGNMAVHVKKTGVSYQLYRIDSYKEVVDERTKKTTQEINQQTIYRIDLNWLNCNTNITKTEDETLEGYNNYYLESCPEGALNVKSYKGITLHNLYKGINLHYYQKNNELKHDYIVAAHADYKQIQVKVEGAEVKINDDGSLLLTTPLGKVQEGAPVVFQNGKQLNAKWILKNNTLSFDIENYDSNYELIIDPITRIWGTYYGGGGNDEGHSCTTDASGNVFEVGASGFGTGTVLATTGSYQTSFTGGGAAFLVKFNSNGVRQWGTYYGGNQSNEGRGCCADGMGNIYLCGNTSSSNGISTAGSHQPTYGSGSDGFLVKFNSSGIRQWGTYYGGGGNEYLYSCAIDGSDNVYIAGETNSSGPSIIATFGSHQFSYGGGNSDAFLAKFNSSGVRQWGTYYGGSTGYDIGGVCAVDPNNNVYLAGVSGSTVGTIIATLGSHQSSYGGGQSDAFLVKFDSSGLRLWSTYYGGNGYDGASTCVTDPSGNIIMAGLTYTSTSASTIIATPAGHQPSYGGGNEDGFIVKFDASGARLWGSYYGGNGIDDIYGSASDTFGNIYIVGNSDFNVGTVIATNNGHQPIFGGGTLDAFLVKFDASGVRQSATYYGGNGTDNGRGCATDLAGNVYLIGTTQSSTALSIGTINGHQSAWAAGEDGFLAKFDACDLAPSTPNPITGSPSICAGITTTYNTSQSFGGNSYTWSLPSSWSGTSNSSSISATPGTSGVFTLTASNACGTSPQQTLNITVNDLPTIGISSNINLLCLGESAVLTAIGAVSYTFNTGGTGTSITVTPSLTTTYSVNGVDANGCYNTAVVTQSVSDCTGIQNLAEALEATFKFYPNPTKGVINIESSLSSEVTIMNVIGEQVYRGNLLAGFNEIHLDTLISGTYIIRIKSAYKKFILLN